MNPHQRVSLQKRDLRGKLAPSLYLPGTHTSSMTCPPPCPCWLPWIWVPAWTMPLPPGTESPPPVPSGLMHRTRFYEVVQITELFSLGFRACRWEQGGSWLGSCRVFVSLPLDLPGPQTPPMALSVFSYFSAPKLSNHRLGFSM